MEVLTNANPKPYCAEIIKKLKNEGIFKDSYCTLDEVVNELCQLRSTN